MLLMLLGIFTAYSQPVVISEYLVGGNQNQWTELLVVQDNVSLVGYKLRDNSQDESWQGGVIFRDHALWRNLRRGTIIIVNHRGFPTDEKREDGFVDIGAQSGMYFEQFMEQGTTRTWVEAGLNLNYTSDMVQILDPQGNHVHVLAHASLADKQVLFASLPNPKIGVQDAAPAQGYSLRVVPGSNLSQYDGGLNYSLATMDRNNISRGTPNNSNTVKGANQLYWRSLRQPDWTNPAITSIQIVGSNKDQIKLTWNPASTISDTIEGYMILRYIENNNYEPVIEDGKIYNIGHTWGPYMLIAYVKDLTNNEFIDKFDAIPGVSFQCGKKYGYRIYAYRYSASDENAATIDIVVTNARGRQYNETQFAQSIGIIKEVPPTPVISSMGDKFTFCTNDEAILTSSIKDLQKYIYEWYNSADPSFSGNEHTVTVKKSGQYYLRLVDKNSGCETISNNITISALEAPEVMVSDPLTFRTFMRDTIIQMCIGETQRLRGIVNPPQSSEFYWIKDGIEITTNNEINVNEAGVYRFIALKNGLCPDTSVKIDIRIVNPDFLLSENALNFNADTDPEKEITLTNNTTQAIIFNAGDVIISGDGFSIISPMPEAGTNTYTIPASGSLTFRIRFSPVGFGTREGQITFRAPCNITRLATLTGVRPNTGVSVLDAAPSFINFGVVPINCDQMKDSTINLISSGNDKFMVFKPTMRTNYFDVSSPRFNNPNERTIINENSQMSLTVRVLPNSPGVYYDTAYVTYHILVQTDKIDTIKIPLSVELIDPKLTFSPLHFDFSALPTCVAEIDTFIIVKNTSGYAFNITRQASEPKFSMIGLPYTLNHNDEVQIPLRIRFTDKDPYYVNIPYLPCTMLSPQIAIIPPQIDFTVDVPDSVNFGIIKNCENPGTVPESIEINTSHDVSRIGNIIYSGANFTTTIANGITLKESLNEFSVTFIRTQPGKYIDSVVFIIEPCKSTHKIILTAERINPLEPLINGLQINFGTNTLGVAGRFSQNWTNPNEDEDMVIDLISVPAPFELVSHTIVDFPIVVPPLGNITFEYEFKRNVVGNYSDYVTAKLTHPCKLDYTFAVTGESIDNRLIPLRSELRPANIVANLGETFTIPIHVAVAEGYSLNGSGATFFELYLSYEPSMLFPEGLIVNLPYRSNITQATMIEIQPGLIKIDAIIGNDSNLTGGNWLTINAKALLGKKLIAPIRIDSMNFVSVIAIEVEDFEGQLQIVGNCDLDNRLLDLSGNVGMVLKGENPIRESVELVFSTVTEDLTSIQIYNSFGQLVKTVAARSFKPGYHTINLNASEYTTGSYFIRMISGTAVRTEKFIILK